MQVTQNQSPPGPGRWHAAPRCVGHSSVLLSAWLPLSYWIPLHIVSMGEKGRREACLCHFLQSAPQPKPPQLTLFLDVNLS